MPENVRWSRHLQIPAVNVVEEMVGGAVVAVVEVVVRQLAARATGPVRYLRTRCFIE